MKLPAFLRDDRGQGGIITLFFAVGVLGHSFLPRWMEVLTPPVLWIYGIIVAILTTLSMVPDGLSSRSDVALKAGRRRAGRRFMAWVAATYAVTFALEAVGTRTGLIFGPYTYGSVLGLMVFAVPLVIGFNWVLVVLGAMRMVQRLPVWAAIIGAGLITTLFDYLMEPVAIYLGYWTWHWDGIPIQNYAAWFLTSAAATAAYRGLRIRMTTRLPAYYLVIQTLFFIAVRILSISLPAG